MCSGAPLRALMARPDRAIGLWREEVDCEGGGNRLEDYVMDVTGKIRDSEAAGEGGNILQQPCTWRPRAPGPRCRLGLHF